MHMYPVTLISSYFFLPVLSFCCCSSLVDIVDDLPSSQCSHYYQAFASFLTSCGVIENFWGSIYVKDLFFDCVGWSGN